MGSKLKKVGGKALLELKKRWKLVCAGIGVSTILDLLRQHYELEMTSWLLSHFGKMGRWLLGNPFALLTVVLVGVVLWILWVALNEVLAQSESAIVGPRKEKLFIPRFSTQFLASVLIVGLSAVSAVSYGAYRYYKTPLPIIIVTSGNWFAENYKGADLYIAIRLENFSDIPTRANIEGYVTVYGQPMPENVTDTGVPKVLAVTVPPWGEITMHPQLWFHGNRDLMDAYHRNAIRVNVTAKYNNGVRDVTYTFVGRIESDTACNGCESNIDILEDSTI